MNGIWFIRLQDSRWGFLFVLLQRHSYRTQPFRTLVKSSKWSNIKYRPELDPPWLWLCVSCLVAILVTLLQMSILGVWNAQIPSLFSDVMARKAKVSMSRSSWPGTKRRIRTKTRAPRNRLQTFCSEREKRLHKTMGLEGKGDRKIPDWQNIGRKKRGRGRGGMVLGEDGSEVTSNRKTAKKSHSSTAAFYDWNRNYLRHSPCPFWIVRVCLKNYGRKFLNLVKKYENM